MATFAARFRAVEAAPKTDIRDSSGAKIGHRYTYTLAGELQTRSETDGGTNTFGYDGADQLTSEVRTGPVAFSEGYTYDHNGNRLTETVNGNLAQSFTYNQHDVLISGINETLSWDLNGNMTGDTLNGQHIGYTYDDEDRLTSVTLPDGHTDSFSYNGLGMRLTKNDPTGNYAYLNDGFSPASAVLTDGYSTFTPGISETKGAAGGGYASVFYLADASGNSRGLLNGSGTTTDGYNWDAFGNLMSRFGSNPTMFAWNEESGYQSDSDDGLTLLGHRYYDKRTGRFISQDPAGDGGNWYQYGDNDPMNETDPSGLSDGLPGSLGAPDSHYGLFEGGPDDMSIGAPDDSWIEKGLELDTRTRTRSGTWVWTPDPTEDEPGHGSWGVVWGPWSDWTVISRTPLGLAENESYQRPGESNAHYFWRGVWWAFKQFVTLQPAPGEGGVGTEREINKTPDLTGKSRAEVDEILKDRGFVHKGQTAGGYEKYYHPDGGKIQIRPNGEVSRYYGSRGARVDQFGNATSSHNTGEVVK